MWQRIKPYRNIILVSTLIGSMLVFMFGTAIYVSSQVANCSSAKKAKNLCMTSGLFTFGKSKKESDALKEKPFAPAH